MDIPQKTVMAVLNALNALEPFGTLWIPSKKNREIAVIHHPLAVLTVT